LSLREPLDRQGIQLMKLFYVYEHWRPDRDLCFYVGKGKGPRSRNFRDRNSRYKQVLDELSAQGMCVEVRMVASGLTESQAFRLERDRIKFWRGRGIDLANRTDGGEGFSGFVRPLGIKLSEEARAKLSAARKGMVFTPEHRAKLSAKKIGKPRPPFTDATREKMRAAAARREAEKRRLYGTNVRRDSVVKGFS
jgi:hypothetical protein